MQYPPRELCRTCLSASLDWALVEEGGEVLTTVDLHHSLEPWFSAHLPWQIASVLLDCGGVAMVHIAPTAVQRGSRVRLRNVLDASGESVLYAVPAGDADTDQIELETLLEKYASLD